MARVEPNGSNPDTSVADIEKQIALLKADIADLGATLSDYGQKQQAILKSTAADRIETLKAKGVENADALRKQVESAYAGAEDSVRNHPAASIGIAAAFGFLVGLVTARR
jgi:ElaB/YqjD/DUF883 family membrane-anchored ribosome-binding protein